MSSDPLVIAVDSSTTSTKAIVVDASGAVLASGQCEIAMSQPGPDRYEHDPRDWRGSTDAAVREALGALSDADRGRIEAFAVTPQRQSFALVDDAGEPIRPGILWLDGRASEQVRAIGSEDVHRLSGFQPDVTPSIYKIAWLAQHEPENVAKATRVAGVHGYLVHALTGEWVDSQGTADSLGLFDMAALEFSDRLLDLAGLRREQVPDLVPSGTVIADTTAEVTNAWGLAKPIPVVACCGDGQAAGLGCGAIGPDEAYLNMGTALVAGVHSPVYEAGDVYRTDAAGLPGHYVLEIVQNSGAYLAGWFRSELGDPALQGKPDPALDEAAAAVPIGSGGLMTLPYFNAVQSPYWNPLARGAMVGFSGSDGRPEMYRSILEALSLEMARNLRGLQDDTGTPLASVRVMGGGQRSPLWRRIMTDCVGLPLTACEQEEISAMGAAVMAMAATGAHADIPTAAKAMTRLGDVSEPDPAAHETYLELSDVQGRIYAGLTDVFEARDEFLRRHQS
ncbi:xylulokinase [Nigerium massiliense]|uniref:xylulokinase n=1 Tax=Nigerium massiliense TaxID=1522317 RepID=UPI00058D2FBE|nr:FGGY family carbohydrate kinase [Nigerium massiliense]